MRRHPGAVLPVPHQLEDVHRRHPERRALQLRRQPEHHEEGAGDGQRQVGEEVRHPVEHLGVDAARREQQRDAVREAEHQQHARHHLRRLPRPFLRGQAEEQHEGEQRARRRPAFQQVARQHDVEQGDVPVVEQRLVGRDRRRAAVQHAAEQVVGNIADHPEGAGVHAARQVMAGDVVHQAEGAAEQRRLDEQPEIAEVVAPEARAELAQGERPHHAELHPQRRHQAGAAGNHGRAPPPPPLSKGRAAAQPPSCRHSSRLRSASPVPISTSRHSRPLAAL